VSVCGTSFGVGDGSDDVVLGLEERRGSVSGNGFL
jgi:hypothetical protein